MSAKDNSKLEQTVAEIVKLDVSLDTDDLVSVRLSSIEKQLSDRKREIQAKVKDVDAQLEALDKQIEAANQSEAEKVLAAKVKQIVKALKPLFPHVNSEISGAQTTRKGKPVFLAQVNISVRNSPRNDRADFDQGGIQKAVYVNVPQSLISLDKQRVALGQSRTLLLDEGVAVQRMMGQMGSYERQVRGHLARVRLEGAKGGKDLLKKLDAFQIAGIEDLHKALSKDRSDRWFELETVDSKISIDLSQVVYVRIDTEEQRVGF